jgi:hypothetical protein
MSKIPDGWWFRPEVELIPYAEAATEDEALRLARERLVARIGDGPPLIDWDDHPQVIEEAESVVSNKEWTIVFSAYSPP